MIRVMFVCSGNVCRSPMAEFIFRELVQEARLDTQIDCASGGTNVFAPNSPVHNGTQRKLHREGIPFGPRGSVALTKADYVRYDYLVGMEQSHVVAMLRLFDGDPEAKLYRLLDFTDSPRDIDDPWYTGDFDAAYRDIQLGCRALLAQMEAHDLSSQDGRYGHGQNRRNTRK